MRYKSALRCAIGAVVVWCLCGGVVVYTEQVLTGSAKSADGDFALDTWIQSGTRQRLIPFAVSYWEIGATYAVAVKARALHSQAGRLIVRSIRVQRGNSTPAAALTQPLVEALESHTEASRLSPVAFVHADIPIEFGAGYAVTVDATVETASGTSKDVILNFEVSPSAPKRRIVPFWMFIAELGQAG